MEANLSSPQGEKKAHEIQIADSAFPLLPFYKVGLESIQMFKFAWAGNSKWFNCRNGEACTELAVEC